MRKNTEIPSFGTQMSKLVHITVAQAEEPRVIGDVEKDMSSAVARRDTPAVAGLLRELTACLVWEAQCESD